MLEKVSDFFKDVKERTSSPLFSSFIISWLVTNWKVVIGLFFYDIYDIQKDGYKSFIDLIEHQTWLQLLLYPLLACLFYTFIYPYINYWIRWFLAERNRALMDKTLEVSGSGKVSMRKYLDLRDIYQKRTKDLEDVYEKENTHFKENIKLTTESLELKKQVGELQMELSTSQDAHQALGYEFEQLRSSKRRDQTDIDTIDRLKAENNKLSNAILEWEKFSDQNIINGDWLFTEYPDTPMAVGYMVKVGNGNLVFPSNYPNQTKVWTIESFSTNLLTNQVVIILSAPNNKGDFTFFSLYIGENFQTLSGHERFAKNVRFKRTN